MVDGNPGGPVSPSPGGPAPGPVVTPWTPDLLRPLFDAVLPEVEKLRVESKVSLAERIGDRALVDQVKRDAPWNPVAKATVISQGPVEGARALNAIGIPAEHGGAVALVTAAVALFVADRKLSAKLEQILAKHGPKPEPSP